MYRYESLRTGRPAVLEALHGARDHGPEDIAEWPNFHCRGEYWCGTGTYFSLFDDTGFNPLNGCGNGIYEGWALARLTLRNPFVVRSPQWADHARAYIDREAPGAVTMADPGGYQHNLSMVLRDLGHDASIMLPTVRGCEMGAQVCLYDPGAAVLLDVFAPDDLSALCEDFSHD